MAAKKSKNKGGGGNGKRFAVVIVVLLALAELFGTAWFIVNVLYGAPAQTDIAGGGKTANQVDTDRVEAMIAKRDAKTAVPATDPFANIRNPFTPQPLPAPVPPPAAPPNEEPQPSGPPSVQ